MHLQNKVISLKWQLLKSNSTLHSLERENWNVWIEFFSFKKTHVSFSWILHRILNHFQKKGILSESIAFTSNAILHSICAVRWRVWKPYFWIRETHVGFQWMLQRILMHLQNNVISLKLKFYKVMQHSIHFKEWIEMFQ